MQEKFNECATNEDIVKVIQEFEQIIKNKKSDIVWLAYYQGKIFRKIQRKRSLLAIYGFEI